MTGYRADDFAGVKDMRTLSIYLSAISRDKDQAYVMASLAFASIVVYLLFYTDFAEAAVHSAANMIGDRLEYGAEVLEAVIPM